MSEIVNQEFREKVILSELARGPQGYVSLLRQASEKGLSTAVFQATFTHLHKQGRIKKSSLGKRAPWIITEKGQKLLEALS